MKKYQAKKISDNWVHDEGKADYAKRFNKLSQIIANYCMHTTSAGEELNLMGWSPFIRKKISNLPDYEQAYILHKFNRFSKLKTALGGLKIGMKKELGTDYEDALETRKTYILELYAQHYNSEDIHKKLIEESGMSISFSSIRKFYLKHKVEIEKLRFDYEKDVNFIGISRKRSRLEILDYMLRKTKQDYDKSNGQRMIPFSREMSRILEQARKEVEGEQLYLNIDGSINITSTIESAKSVEKLYADINFMNLLISRVAARMRINPLLLQYQLTNSWYAKFTGIKRNDSLMDEIPNYPSKIILNWGDIQEKADKYEEKINDMKQKFDDEVEFVPIDEDKDKAEKLRIALKSKLKFRQDDLDNIKERILGVKK